MHDFHVISNLQDFHDLRDFHELHDFHDLHECHTCYDMYILHALHDWDGSIDNCKYDLEKCDLLPDSQTQ